MDRLSDGFRVGCVWCARFAGGWSRVAAGCRDGASGERVPGGFHPQLISHPPYNMVWRPETGPGGFHLTVPPPYNMVAARNGSRGGSLLNNISPPPWCFACAPGCACRRVRGRLCTRCDTELDARHVNCLWRRPPNVDFDLVGICNCVMFWVGGCGLSCVCVCVCCGRGAGDRRERSRGVMFIRSRSISAVCWKEPNQGGWCC